MAIGTKDSLVIYHEEFWGGVVETVQQVAEGFGGATGGAIRLVTDLHRGDFLRESFFQEVSGLVSRRDPTSTSTVADSAFTQDEFVGVKLARRLGPVSNTRDSFRKIAEDPSNFSMLLGRQFGPAIAQDYLNSAITALVAALETADSAALLHDAEDGTIETADLVDGLALMGDRAERIGLWVMHSKVYFDLVKDQIADAIYRANGMDILVREGLPATLGRPVYITDSPNLTVTDGVTAGTDSFKTLGLVQNGAVVQESEERDIVTDLVTGEDNIRDRIQGEHSFTLSLKGFKWDMGNGLENPNDTALGTGTNWDKAATDNKMLAGVVISSQ